MLKVWKWSALSQTIECLQMSLKNERTKRWRVSITFNSIMWATWLFEQRNLKKHGEKPLQSVPRLESSYWFSTHTHTQTRTWTYTCTYFNITAQDLCTSDRYLPCHFQCPCWKDSQSTRSNVTFALYYIPCGPDSTICNIWVNENEKQTQKLLLGT